MGKEKENDDIECVDKKLTLDALNHQKNTNIAVVRVAIERLSLFPFLPFKIQLFVHNCNLIIVLISTIIHIESIINIECGETNKIHIQWMVHAVKFKKKLIYLVDLKL